MPLPEVQKYQEQKEMHLKASVNNFGFILSRLRYTQFGNLKVNFLMFKCVL